MNGTEFDGMNRQDEMPGEPNAETLPIGIGDGEDTTFDPLAATTSSRRSGGGFLVIMLVVIGAVAGLYSMRMLSRLTAGQGIDSAAQSEVKAFLDGSPFAEPFDTDVEGTGTTIQKDDQMLAVIQDDRTDQQVPLSEVQHDPFVIYEAGSRVVETPVVIKADETPEEKDARRRKEIQDGADHLTLMTVLGGSNPLANIDGEIVRIGDILTVSGFDYQYEVVRIMPAAVELEVQDDDLINGAAIVNLIVRR